MKIYLMVFLHFFPSFFFFFVSPHLTTIPFTSDYRQIYINSSLCLSPSPSPLLRHSFWPCLSLRNIIYSCACTLVLQILESQLGIKYFFLRSQFSIKTLSFCFYIRKNLYGFWPLFFAFALFNIRLVSFSFSLFLDMEIVFLLLVQLYVLCLYTVKVHVFMPLMDRNSNQFKVIYVVFESIELGFVDLLVSKLPNQ